MKAVILAGGLGSRLSASDSEVPKPMTLIGNKPILWHIMKHYSEFGINEFVICAGYKSYAIKEYFLNYAAHASDIEIDLISGKVQMLNQRAEPWVIQIIDTGLETMTGGRLRRIAEYVGEEFCLTYGDGLANVDISGLIDSHRISKSLVTVTAVHLPGRFGSLSVNEKKIIDFQEKSDNENSWVNGGFFVVNKKALSYIDSDSTVWEREPLKRLAHEGQLNPWFHEGFWLPMDTPRDLKELQTLWASNNPPWKTWE
jgi:glucose-1-phosphate cytidylyltransferase